MGKIEDYFYEQKCEKILPERVLQFGEGNFLRAFVDYFIDLLNGQDVFNGSIVVVQPIEHGLIDELNSQKGLYTVLLRGLENGKPVTEKRVVTSISRGIDPYRDYREFIELAGNADLRYIISNTTEAGIAFVESDKFDDEPQSSFPGKVTRLLYERYEKLGKGSADAKGFIFIPCELIDNSGDELKKAVLKYAEHWNLSKGFIDWVHSDNYFANTLVDRIVTGYPKDEAVSLFEEFEYEDNLLVTAENFNFFAIEAGGKWAEQLKRDMPFWQAGVNAIVTEDVTPYKQRKVRILNGAHTMSVLAAFLAGHETVGEMMSDPLFVKYLRQGIFNEIIPTLDFEMDNLKNFADSVFDRFANPHIKHYLLSIALNSVSKFRARVLPSILEYYKRKGRLPECLTLSFAALVKFYKSDDAKDDQEILDFMKAATVTEICARVDYWGFDLNELGLGKKVSELLEDIEDRGIEVVIKNEIF